MRRFRFPLVAAALACVLGVASRGVLAQAQSSGIEVAAAYGGRVVGAAKACGINAERIRKVSDRMLSVVAIKSVSAAENRMARDYFGSNQSIGAEQIRADKSRCSSIHVDFSEMEVKLTRPVVREHEALALKRGGPALGALGTDAAGVTHRD